MRPCSPPTCNRCRQLVRDQVCLPPIPDSLAPLIFLARPTLESREESRARCELPSMRSVPPRPQSYANMRRDCDRQQERRATRLHIRNQSPRLLRRPQSTSNDLVSMQLMHCFGDLHMPRLWLALVPAHLHRDQALAAAAKSAIFAFQARHGQSLTAADSSARCCSQAITSLQKSMSLSDPALLTISLLAMRDSVIGASWDGCGLNVASISAFLRARGKAVPPDEFASSVLYAHKLHKFAMP